jgi:tRNA(Arg) A34 adenosine deaminase TadA
VGACASTVDGEIIHASRNRVNDEDGPHGEIFGSSLAHAETNVLSRIKFRQYRGLVLTTTLQPCVQCAAAIRLAPVGTVRFAGHDGYWDGLHEFSKLAVHEVQRRRPLPTRVGPRDDALGAFGLLIARFRVGNPRLVGNLDVGLRTVGQGPLLDLAYEIEDSGELQDLMLIEVDQALAAVWPRLQKLKPS